MKVVVNNKAPLDAEPLSALTNAKDILWRGQQQAFAS